MPQASGSRKPSAALTAIAASTALPPDCSTSMPICTASGCDAATMPCRAWTTERVANIRPSGRAAPSEAVGRQNSTASGGTRSWRIG